MLLAPIVYKKRPQQSLVDHVRHLWALPYFLEQGSFFDQLGSWHSAKLGRIDFEMAVEKSTLQFIQNQPNESLPNPIEGHRLRPVQRACCMPRSHRLHLAHLPRLLTSRRPVYFGSEASVQLVKDIDAAWAAEDMEQLASFFADTCVFDWYDGKSYDGPEASSAASWKTPWTTTGTSDGPIPLMTI